MLGAAQEIRLGGIDGVALSLTDAAGAADGIVLTAAAEATDDPYLDGPVSGSAIGVWRAGALGALHRLRGAGKVEGICAAPGPGGGYLLVTDADDRADPAWLMSVRDPGV
jgi:hypothetical protein